MLVGVIADDFTGASDIANTLALGIQPEGGLRTAQYSGVPNHPSEPDIEAGVISLKSRSTSVAEAVESSLDAFQWLKEQGCQQYIFKYCSTFDSTKIGNIGPVAEALLNAIGSNGTIFCPSFPKAGRTVYQGHLFVFDNLLSESGMQHHPITPMTDADIRRWLGYQCKYDVGHVPLSVVSTGAAETLTAIEREIDNCKAFTVVDAVSEDNLIAIGEAVADLPLVTGGSGIALGIPRNFIRKGAADGDGVFAANISGPEVILAGSCSGATMGQIEYHQQNHPTYAVDVHGVMNGTVNAGHLIDFVLSNRSKLPLVYSSGSPPQVKAIQDQYGQQIVSDKLDELFAAASVQLLDAGYKKIVVAGGETSGAVAKAISLKLGVSTMRIGPEIDPGVPILILGRDTPVGLALKSGNFGSEDFFQKAIHLMGPK